ncbi:MAG: Dna2/Cas4 domain-containing protein, partial [Firmicutes bacterium]|nr:Dna2/Cas4 domain-containing protein [Bacillota bacterium]
MIADTNQITIRSIQHYLYCPHRWGLLEVGRVWSENAFVVKANIMHERVHGSENSYTPYKGRKVYTAVKVYNDKPEYGIYGVTDCIETDEKQNICIVEYKPTKPKTSDYNFEDLMQVFAQKICVDYIFKCDCDAVIY